MTQREMNWFDQNDNSLGFFPHDMTPDGDYICPKCGKPATYWEGVIGQDRQGNDLRGWSYDCPDCKIGTMETEF